MRSITMLITGFVIISSISMLGLLLISEEVNAKTTIDVGSGQTIQDAINLVQEGMDSEYVINVLSTYDNQETGTIDIDMDQYNTPNSKSITIKGPANKEALVTQNPNTDIMSIHFSLYGESLTIENLEFLATETGCTALDISESSNINIEACSVSSGSEDFDVGYYFEDCYQIRINNSDISSFSDFGISMEDVYNSGTAQNPPKGILNSTIAGEDYNEIGIQLSDCDYIKVQNNSIKENGFGLKIIGSRNSYVTTYSTYNQYIYENGDYGIEINDNGITQEMSKSKSNLFENSHIFSNTLGCIHIVDVSVDIESNYYNTFKNNKIYDSSKGYHIDSSQMVEIIGENTIINDTSNGVYIDSSDYIALDFDCESLSDDPIIYDNDDWGLYACNSDRIYVKDAIFENNGNYDSSEGNIKMYNTTRFEIGGNNDDSSYIGLIEDRVEEKDMIGIEINGCDHTGEVLSSFDGWIKDVEIDMEYQDEGTYVIEIISSDGVTIEDSYNSDGSDIDNCILVSSSENVNIINVNFIAEDLEEEDGMCIYVYQSSDISIGIVTTNWIKYFEFGVYIDDCDYSNSVVFEAQIEYCYDGLVIEDSQTGTYGTYAVSFVNRAGISSKIDNCEYNAIYMCSSSLLLRDFQIDGCDGTEAILNEDGTTNDHLYIDDTASISTSGYYVVTDGSSCLTRDISEEALSDYDEVNGGTYQTT